MSIQNLISVNAHYTRSVNLERDANSIGVVSAYIPTSRALRTLERISSSFDESQSPRAWSLVGPYGSGKSSFSVFLSQLLSNKSDLATKEAYKILKDSNPDLFKRFDEESKRSDGHLKILVSGSPEPMSKRLVEGMASAAEVYWSSLKGTRKPNTINKLKSLANKEAIETSEVLALLKELQTKLEQVGCGGILLIIDELGKFLEYEARHYGANDIYLLQALAEHACAGSKTNLYLFVLLHQSFEQYAKGLGESLKNEWSKVQGRFEEVPFLESAEQVLRVVSAAFEQNLTAKQKKSLRDEVTKNATPLVEKNALPNALNLKEAVNLFLPCYPLHPVSSVLLPLLCQKVAQNERTLFSYLGSYEDFGMQDMLERLENLGDFILPHNIFDYFISNQPAVMGDYLTHRRWAEVVTALERLGDASENEIKLLKTIGILNIIGSKGGFKASKPLLESCFSNKSAFRSALKQLTDKSIVNFRRYNSEYRVWQGSDFDLEAALQDEMNNIGNFSLASELNADKHMLPVVARKYTIETGSLRYFTPSFVDAQSYKTTPHKAQDPRIIFYLAAGQDDEKLFREVVSKHFSELDIVVLCLSGSQLRESVGEVIALNRVQKTRQELNIDPVAKREFDDRLTAAQQSEEALLRNLIDYPQDSEWWHQGTLLAIKSKRELQVEMSTLLNEVFSKTPRIANELINRDKPSAQAKGATKKLLQAILQSETKLDLGIEKFPPEKSIYRAFLREAGMHVLQQSGEWKFVVPGSDNAKDRVNLLPAWEKIDRFLDSTDHEAKSFFDLNQELMAPPYGIKAGLLPILYIAVYAVYQDELAIYEARRYKPYFTEEMVERFIKRPDEFTFQRFKISGLKASLFKQYSQVIHGDTKKRTLLELAKPLATFMGSLPDFTQKTKRDLSDNAMNIRHTFNLAKSPENLLFEHLPKALGYEGFSNDSSDNVLSGFAKELTDALRELKGCYDRLLSKQLQLLQDAFKVNKELTLNETRKIITGQCHDLENYTVDTKGLRAFIMRINKAQSKDEEWFENILMFLGHKPSSKWLNSDQDTAEYRLTDFSRRVIDLEKLRVYEKSKSASMKGDFDVYLLRSIKKGHEILDEVVAVDQQSLKSIEHTKQAIQSVIDELPDKELKLAALAEIVDSFLQEYKDGAKKKPPEQASLILHTGGEA